MYSHHNDLFSLFDVLSAIRQLAAIPLQELSEQAFAEQALEALSEYQELECCSLFALEEHKLTAIAGLSTNRFGGPLGGHFSSQITGLGLPADEGIMAQACESGLPQYYRNCQAEQQLSDNEQRWLCPGAGSLLSIPVTGHQQVLGVLNVSHHLPEFFETWQQHFLALFASLLGRSIHQRRMLQEADDEIERLKAALRQANDECDRLQKRLKSAGLQVTHPSDE